VRAVSSIYAEHDAAQYAYWIADIDDAYGSAIWWVVDEAQMGEFKKDHSHIVLDGTAVVGTNVDVQADWELTYSTSVRAAKTNIRDFMADRQVFMDLKPTIYNAIEAPSGPPIIGLIAEDVAETLPGLATFLDKRGLSRSRPKGEPPELELVGWDDKQMLVTMISVVQQQEQDLTALEARVAMLESA